MPRSNSESPTKFDALIFGVLSLIIVGVMTAAAVQVRSNAAGRLTDFAAFYAGAHLLGDGRLYDSSALQDAERLHTGTYSAGHGYVRMPFHAVLLGPLSHLDYAAAEWAWRIVLAAAVIGFVALWPLPARWLRLSSICLSLPIFAAFINGQDSPLLLLFIAVSMRLHRRGNARAAGMAAALCAIKFHLFLLLPIWIVTRRDMRFMQGLSAGAAVLVLVSFAAAGFSWPLDWFRAATSPDFSPSVGQMPNLYGVATWLGLGAAAEVAAGIAVAAATWFVARRGDPDLSLACCLAGGLLVSRHAYLPDMVVLLPAGLSAISQRYSAYLRLSAALVLLPPVAYATLVGPHGSAIAVGVIVVFVALIAREAWRPSAVADELHS